MPFVITKSGNDEGYGEPIAIAFDKKEVENFIKSHASISLMASGYTSFDRVVLSGKIEKPYNWRKRAYCVKANALNFEGALVIGTSYEVFQATEAAKLESLEFFGE